MSATAQAAAGLLQRERGAFAPAPAFFAVARFAKTRRLPATRSRIWPAPLAVLVALVALAGSARPALASSTTDCFRTTASGNWNATGTWQSAPTIGSCTVWSAATLTPTSSASTITIRSPHTVHVTTGVTIDQTTIDSGGDLEVDSGIILLLNHAGTPDLLVNGTLGVTGTLTQQTSSTGSYVEVGGTGTLTVFSGGLINGTGGAGSTRPKLTVDSGGQWTINSGGSLTSNGTGGMELNVMAGGTATLNGSVATGTSGVATTFNGTVTASANITLATISDLEIGGTVTMTAGQLTVNRGNGGSMGSINSGGSLILQGSSIFAISGVATSSYTVASGGTLDMGPSAIVNGGSLLTVASGSNLKIGSADGITTGTTNGNVRTTATDSYSTGANYTYDGTAPQTTGNALPATVNNLTINNSTSVTLSGSVTVNGSLSVSAGTFDQGASFNLIANTGISISSGATYRDVGTGGLTLGGGLSNAGAVQINSGTTACGEADSILIRSTVSGTQRAWSGAGTFDIQDVDVKDQGGSASITAYSSTNSGNNGGNWNIRTHCALDHFAVTNPGTQTAGTPFAITTITAQDAANNTVTNYTGTVDLTETGGGAGGTVSPTQSSAFTNGALQGQSVTLSKSGSNVTITVTDHGGTKTGVSGTFTVSPGALDHFAVGVIGTKTAGTPFAVTITAQDVNGNTVTGYTGTVDLTETGGGAGGTVTPSPSNPFSSGSLSQNFTLTKSGSNVTITVTDHGGTRTGVSGAFTVNPGAANKLAFGTQPSDTAAGSSITPAVTVRILDFYDNLTSSTASVTVAIGTNPSSGTLSGTLTRSAVGGVATFNDLSIDNPGTGYTLTAASTGLTGATSSSFNITGGAATKLAFGTQPSNAQGGSLITPQVTVRILDANDNLVSGSTASVTVAIGPPNPGSGTLSGTLTQSASGGVATFSNLSIDKEGTNYTLTAASTGLTGATSGTFNITGTAYWIDNAAGSDSNSGNQSSPFGSIGHAASLMGNSGTLYVQIGNSQSGSPYAANNVVTVAGTASNPVRILGVANGSTLPLVVGADPAADAGFDVQANYVTVSGFQIQNTQVGLYSEPSKIGTQFTNNYVLASYLGYGVILDTTSSATVYRNLIEPGSGAQSFFGIWDYAGSGNTIDSNTVTGQGADGIASHYSTGLTIQRNIVAGNPSGIHVSHASGAVHLYNNTVDHSNWLGIYVEQSPAATVTSRNNIISNGGALGMPLRGYGWGWDGTGTIDSNYDDVFNNTHDYDYTAVVTPGKNSLSADPNFVQTTDPTGASYYQLNLGSPCINTGVNVGLPKIGSGWDIGAVESN